MSKEVDRYAVFQTTKVRTPLRNDGCWIQKSKRERDEASPDQTKETSSATVRRASYVLSTAKKFESVDYPMSPPPKNTQIAPFEGDSVTQANGEVIPPQKDVQLEESTVETTHDAKPQAPIEQLFQNGDAQPEDSVTNTTAENKEEHAAVCQPHVEYNAEVSAEIAEGISNDEAQVVSSAEEKPVGDTTPENNGDHADTTGEPSEHNEATTSTDAHAETAAAPADELQPQEQPSTEATDTTHLEDAGGESTFHPEEGICKKPPAEQTAGDTVEAVAEVVAKPSSDTSDVESATPVKEAALQERAVAEVAMESSTETPAVTGAAGEQASVEPVPDLLAESGSESPTQPDNATDGSYEKGPPEQTAVEAVAEVAVETSAETPAVTGAAGEQAAPQSSVEPVPDLLAESGSESPTQPDNATDGSYEKGPPEQTAVEAVAEVAVETSAETPAVTGAAGEQAAPQASVEPVPDLLADTGSEPLSQAAAETAVEPVECKVESAASAEQLLKTGAEEAVESEVQAVDNITVETSVEPTPERAADPVVEVNVEDVVEAVPDQFSDRPIELSEALDAEPPTTEAAPQPPKPSHTEETELNQHSDETNSSDMLQKSKEELQSTEIQSKIRSNVCSYCENIIDGTVKLYLSEPSMTCHPECLKCGVCAKALGDMLTPMYLQCHVVKCGSCLTKVLQTGA